MWNWESRMCARGHPIIGTAYDFEMGVFCHPQCHPEAYRIEGPAVISFSGGRTSAFLLHAVLAHHRGKLPPDVHVAFANTGKEMPQTLDFVRECAEWWGVPITWLEYRAADDPQKRWAEVTHDTASRHGEPFEALIQSKGYLPNPVSRFCTQELKARPMKLWAQQALGWDEWTVVIGLRADEQRRVARLAVPTKEPYYRIAPLATGGITKENVGRFWKAQPFDLQLQNDNGTTPLGNCDLCYLKGYTRITSILRDHPELGEWWARMEREVAGGDAVTGLGGTFRKDRPSYAVMMKQVRDQATIGIKDEPIGDCFCVE